ncbi:MAG TPA: alpha-L-arabinofuranosidase C-terminal domain-containing protein [Cyclobacteriaceae bacterium]|nr:alpha-L-arabinofuranosidase C-terminal domain-containing protein [Cyclobacteriaceae bacterium]
MMKVIFTLMLFCPFYVFPQTAKIKIEVNRTIGEIDPKIYGVFMEPIQFSGRRMGLPDSVRFNTLYGNLYDPSSPLADENGFKKNYIEAMRELKVTNMRWPGGNYVAAYNWQDGIGPKDQRPVRKDLAWGGIDNNHVGTDEWVQLNKSIGSENVLCINLGLGNINDARYWVEYCNLKSGTYYSDLRVKYGHKEPFNIKYWCLGNEVDGAPWIMGHKDVEDYCKIAIEAAKAMRATDNSIKFIANGSSHYSPGTWVDWNWKVISELRDFADYISIHRYWERSDDYYTYVGQSALDIEEKIKILQAQLYTAQALYKMKKPMYLSIDEYAPFGQNMMSTLAVAEYLNSFVRHADVVKMANYTLMTSLLASDNKKGTFKTPLFYTFKMFSNNCLGSSVDTFVECDTFDTELYEGIPYLDVTTVYSKETGAVFINVVNRHMDKSISAEVMNNSGEFAGKAEVSSITGDKLKEAFTYDEYSNYQPSEKDVDIKNNKISYTFPPHSFTQIKVGVKRKL